MAVSGSMESDCSLERIVTVVSSLEGGIHSNSFSKRGKRQTKEIQHFLETAARLDEFSVALNAFAKDLLSTLESCVQTTYLTEVKCREKSCCAFYKQQLNSLPELWTRIHRELGLSDPDPLWFQTANRLIFEDFLATALEVKGFGKHSSHVGPCETSLKIEADQANVIRYAAGYVPFKLLKRYKQKTSPEALAIVDCLSDMAVKGDDASFLAYTSEWIKEINRGGLFQVNDGCYTFFCNLELGVRKHLGSTIGHKFSEMQVIEAISSDENILFHFDVLSSDIPDDHQATLLHEFIEMWVKIRVHAFSKMLLEEYKHQKQVETKKAKSLRASLKQPKKSLQ